MTDETQVAESTSTPDEAQAVPYTSLGEVTEGTTHVDTPTAAEVHHAPADSEHYVESPKVTDESFWDTVAIRPPFILSFVEADHQYGGFVIGWDTCGACNLHLRSCTCKNGPEQPKYVKNWRPAADKNHDKKEPVTPAIRKAVVAADPQAVERAVDDALAAEAPVGRKKRSDAGQPRGPRVKGTPDSVLAAAGDLSAALTKES